MPILLLELCGETKKKRKPFDKMTRGLSKMMSLCLKLKQKKLIHKMVSF